MLYWFWLRSLEIKFVDYLEFQHSLNFMIRGKVYKNKKVQTINYCSILSFIVLPVILLRRTKYFKLNLRWMFFNSDLCHKWDNILSFIFFPSCDHELALNAAYVVDLTNLLIWSSKRSFQKSLIAKYTSTFLY